MGYLPYQLVQDFLHQQYDLSNHSSLEISHVFQTFASMFSRRIPMKHQGILVHALLHVAQTKVVKKNSKIPEKTRTKKSSGQSWSYLVFDVMYKMITNAEPLNKS